LAPLSIDELCFQSLDRRQAYLFFLVVARRYQHPSTNLTSSKSVRDRPEKLAADEVLATALLNRLLHHYQVLSIEGRSFLLRLHQATEKMPA
jgi:DNA replication protein DnaC